MCKACRVAYKQAHHARASSDASTTPAPVETHRRGADELIVDYLRAHPCVARGEADVMVVEFDHLGEKLFSSPGGSATGCFRRSYTRWRSAGSCAQTVTAPDRHQRRFLRAVVAPRQSHPPPR